MAGEEIQTQCAHAKLKDQPTDHAIRFGRASQGSKGSPPEREDTVRAAAPTERHFSELSNREKGAKLIKLARTAVKKDHIGVQDPKDVRKWLIKPGERKYHGHFERFQCDPEYKAQCLRNGCVDKEAGSANGSRNPTMRAGWKRITKRQFAKSKKLPKEKERERRSQRLQSFRGLGTPITKGARIL